MIKKILFVVLLTIIGHSDTVNDNQSQFKTPNQPVYNNQTMECPKVRAGYITRVHHYDYTAGKTYCNVYQIDPNTGVVIDTPQKTPDGAEDVVLVNDNPIAARYYSLPSASDKKSIDADLKKTWDKVGLDIANGSKFKNLEKLYLKDYTTLDNGDKFLTGAKYLLAGLTMDGEIINIPSSIQSNEITLQKGYTIYPNASVNGNNDKDFLSIIKDFINNIRYEKTKKQEFEDNVGVNINLNSQAKTMLDNIIVFIMDFFARVNENYQDVNFMVFALSAIFTVIFASQKKLTSKLSKVHDSDDMYERGFLGFIIIFVFYLSSTTYNIDNEKKIDQTHFQNMSRWLLYKGVDWADSATRSMASSYVSFKLKETGILGKEQARTLSYAKAANELKYNALVSDVKKCSQYYDTDKLGLVLGNAQGNNAAFPETQGELKEEAFLKDEYKNQVRESSGASTLAEIPRVGSCRNSLREATIVANEITQQEYKIQSYQKIVSSDKIQNRMLLITENIYKTTADQGFMAAPVIATTDFFLDMSEIVKTDEQEEAASRAAQDNSSASAMNIPVANTGFSSKIGEYGAYMLVPGATTMQSYIYQAKDKILGDTQATNNGIVNTAWGAVSLVITIMLMMALIKYLPILSLLIASLLVIVFYFISVEIFYLITPFIVAYALTSNQHQTLISLLIRYFALALKPIMIVFSVVVAMLVISLFEGINNAIILPLFNTFQNVLGVAETTNITDKLTTILDMAFGAKMFNNDAMAFLGTSPIIGFIGGIAMITTKIFAVVSVFYIVFNGSDIMLKLFGLREGGIDVQEGLGSQIEGNMGKYGRPI